MIQQSGIPRPDQYVAEPGIGPPPAGRGGHTALIQLPRDAAERTAGENRGGRLADHQSLVLADRHAIGLETIGPRPASILPVLGGLGLLARGFAYEVCSNFVLRQRSMIRATMPPSTVW